MIPHKYQKIVFSFFMAIFMSCIMSLVIIVFNIGLVNNIVSVWLKAWGFAFIVGFPTILIISPMIYKLVALVVEKESNNT